jgi:hypothetical protein
MKIKKELYIFNKKRIDLFNNYKDFLRLIFKLKIKIIHLRYYNKARITNEEVASSNLSCKP